MPRITFILASGDQVQADAPEGISVMRAALDNDVPGIIGDCGGELSCATCHAYVEADWSAAFPPPGDDEAVMVECVIEQRPQSRLSCQLILTAAHDGLIVHVPASQY